MSEGELPMCTWICADVAPGGTVLPGAVATIGRGGCAVPALTPKSSPESLDPFNENLSGTKILTLLKLCKNEL